MKRNVKTESMKKAVQFGAGNIGRGFIGAVLAHAGYRVVFADVNREVVERLEREGRYTVHVMDVTRSTEVVEGVSAVDASGVEAVAAVADADLVTTAVGLNVLPRLAPALAEGIALRRERGMDRPLNVIACENGLGASSRLRTAVLERMDDSLRRYCVQHVGFPDCSVDRIVPPLRCDTPLDVVTERFYEWNVDEDAFVGPPPRIEGMNLTHDLTAYVERKLFTLNTGHAITAYLGRLRGYATIHLSIADRQLRSIVREAMRESGEGLSARYGFDREAHYRYIDRIIARFENPCLNDLVERVGREPLRKLGPADRLVRPTLTAREYGYPTPALTLGIGAALLYDNPDDPESVAMLRRIEQQGLAEAVADFTGIPADAPIQEAIAEARYAAGRLLG